MNNGSIGKTATRADVARQAGVSTGTVSHVLSGGRNVAEATRDRVLRAVDALNYRPNAFARGLNTSRSMQLGVIMPGFWNPYFGMLTTGITGVAKENGYSVLLCDNGQEYGKSLDLFMGRRVDGVILAQYIPLEQLIPLVRERIPLVTCGFGYRGMPDIPSVVPDYAQGTREAIGHLVSLGHRRIAILAGRDDFGPNERLEGCLKALADEGLPPVAVITGDYGPGSGHGSYGAIAESRATAVFSANEHMTMGLLARLYEAGIPVPRGISIVAIDGTWMGEYSTPSLTTFDLDAHGIGRRSAESLLGLVSGEAVGSVRTPGSLVIRGSTAPPMPGSGDLAQVSG